MPIMPANSTEGLDDNIPDNPGAGIPADADDGAMGAEDQPLQFSADQARLLGLENANKGDVYTIQITIGDSEGGNVTADVVPSSAKLEDNTAQPSEGDDENDQGEESPMDKLAPTIRKPKQRTLSPAEAGFAANGDDL